MDPANGPSSSRCVGVMAKFWEPGNVKTRLGRDIGMRAAAAIHREFFDFLAQSLSSDGSSSNTSARNAGDACRLRLEAVVTPPNRLAAFETALAEQRLSAQSSPCWQVVSQCEGDLGDRMRAWFRRSLAGFSGGDTVLGNATSHLDNVPSQAEKPCRAVLLGCDCPLLSADDLAESFELLGRHDVVLGPALDGGYYLIGLAGPYRSDRDALFADVDWGSETVLETTLARIEAAGLSLALLQPRRDIDELDDLQILRQELAVSPELRQQELGQRLSELLRESGDFTDQGKRQQDGI